MNIHHHDETTKVIHGDCIETMNQMPPESVDAIVTDPPYGLSFMSTKWDATPPGVQWAEACYRVLKPGGHIAAFGGTRTWHRLAVAIEDAGFEMRDSLAWLYGCLSEDTEVLINGEWVQYHKAKAGDLALCYDKEHDTYEWQPIEDTHKYEYGDTAYRIYSNNTDQIVSRNHRVLVERGGAYEFEYAENLARERQIRVPILENLPTLLDGLSVREPLPGGEEPILQRELRNVRPSTGCGETDRATRNGGDCVCGMRDESLQAECLVEESGNPNVLTRVQREVARGGMEGARTQGSSGVAGGNESAVRGEPARGEQSGLEGWGHFKEGARELQGCSVCEVSAGVPKYVAEGRVRDGASSCRCESDRSPAGSRRGGASCEPQAGGQSVGEPVSVCVESGSQAVRGARHTVADLADIEPVRYEGIVWCLTVPTGAFVVRRNGKVFVTGNSGFPKSHNVGKSTESEDWDGWGTALKPAFEPIVLARKPLAEKTVARNVLAHGTGAINVDASRIKGEPIEIHARTGNTTGANSMAGVSTGSTGTGEFRTDGRWPANVLLDQHTAAWVDEQSGDIKGRVGMKAKTAVQFGVGRERDAQAFDAGSEDSGGASRFFYNAKAPKTERPNVDGVQHPTVKPLAIMEWLIRLVTPPGGVLLDPFAGSGTTLEAARKLGFKSIGIEAERTYLPLIDQRLQRSNTGPTENT